MSERIREIAQAWAARHGVVFEWLPDRTIKMTGSVGTWFLDTTPINGDDDWISIHPTELGCEIEKVASAGHVEVLRLTPEELVVELDQILKWFAGWKSFMSFGPGRGH